MQASTWVCGQHTHTMAGDVLIGSLSQREPTHREDLGWTITHAKTSVPINTPQTGNTSHPRASPYLAVAHLLNHAARRQGTMYRPCLVTADPFKYVHMLQSPALNAATPCWGFANPA
jgi:hypothetical protein